MSLINLIKTQNGSPEEVYQKTLRVLDDWYVICSITGEHIVLSQLLYWNVELGEVYKDVLVASKRYDEIRTKTLNPQGTGIDRGHNHEV